MHLGCWSTASCMDWTGCVTAVKVDNFPFPIMFRISLSSHQLQAFTAQPRRESPVWRWRGAGISPAAPRLCTGYSVWRAAGVTSLLLELRSYQAHAEEGGLDASLAGGLGGIGAVRHPCVRRWYNTISTESVKVCRNVICFTLQQEFRPTC